MTTFEGLKNSDAITVASPGVKPSLALWANLSSGVPPFSVSFRPEVEGISPIAYRYDFDGNGVDDMEVPTDCVVSYTYASPGMSVAKVTAVDGSGMEYAAERTIVSQERVEVDALLSHRWEALSSSLRAQDIKGGLANLLPRSREKYEAIFLPLSVELPSVFASVSAPELIAVEGDAAQYRVRREQMWEGQVRTITYYLWFVRDEDGVWRIDKF